MANHQPKTTTLRVRTGLLRRIERLAPRYLRGGRKQEMRIDWALERFIEAETAKDAKLAKAG